MDASGSIQSPKTTTITTPDGQTVFRALGVSQVGPDIMLVIHSLTNSEWEFDIASSRDGHAYTVTHANVKIAKDSGYVRITDTDNYHIVTYRNGYALFYEVVTSEGRRVCYAIGEDLDELTHEGYVDHWHEAGVVSRVVTWGQSNYLGLHVDDKRVVIQQSADLIQWDPHDGRSHEVRDGYTTIDIDRISCIQQEGDSCYVWFCFRSPQYEGRDMWSVGWFSLHMSPGRVYLTPATHIWQMEQEWRGAHVYPVGMIASGERVYSYWGVVGRGLYMVEHSRTPAYTQARPHTLALTKHESNPMIAPNADVSWEAFNTLNAAVVQTADTVHILYRAQGYDYVSVLGYVSSRDGVTIDYRSPTPAYTPYEDFETRRPHASLSPGINYGSGGGYGGVEDPRITIIGDRAHMVYVSYDGWSPPRLAYTSIKVSDFLAHRWLWERPVLISPPGIVDKSGCILPEKVRGKYVILHRIFPNILVDYVDTLEFDGRTWLKGEHVIPIRKHDWDSRKIGAGAPPIKTPYGWLLIYYAVDERDAGRYKIGAMLLDLEYPERVLHRTSHPILEPSEWYENSGFKPGVAYPCGAAVIDDMLYVYYGGSDSYVCVSTAPLEEFLAQLRYHDEAQMGRTVVHKIFRH